ncbi:MAG: hypothetical protein LBL98_02370 [Ruminococcus sp.]|jgi:hypothetical protein|nr:hypothetical protein [Ruminococcus sp.]
MSAVNTHGKVVNLSLLAAVFIVGIIGGVTLFMLGGGTPQVGIPYMDKADFIERAVDVFTPAFLSLGAIFLLGFGSIFAGFVPLVLLYNGLQTGLTLAHIYTSSPPQKMFLVLFIIVPYAVFSALVLIVGCREAMRLSVSIFRITISSGYLPVDYRLYINKFIILTAILLTGAIGNAFISGVFTKILGV